MQLSHFCRCLCLFAALLLAMPAWAGDAAPRVVLLTVEQFEGQFVEISSDWSVTFGTGGQTRQLAMTDLVQWGNYNDGASKTQLLLTDGSMLVGSVLQLADDGVLIETELWGDVRVERASVRGMLCAPSASPLQRDRQRKRIERSTAKDALLLLRNGDEVSGQLVSNSEQNEDDFLDGISSVSFVPQGGNRTTFATRNLELIALRPVTRRLEQKQCHLALRDASLIAAARIQTEQNVITIQTACGLSLSAERSRFNRHLTGIGSNRTAVTFLSDLEPTDYKAFPFLSVEWPLGIDENVLGGRLRCGGNVYSKGLGMHATSRAVYDVAGKYSRFHAEIVLDDQAGRRGSVIYRVFVERPAGQARKWSLAYTSPIVRGGDQPRSVSADLSDATRIALAVEAADGGDTLDHANWLHARLIPSRDTTD